jgi:hypothetical protein
MPPILQPSPKEDATEVMAPFRQESQVALRKGTLRAPSQTTLQQAAEEWLAAAAAGVIRTRSGDPRKPCALRAYKQALRHRVLPTYGQKRLTGISTNMLQDLADGLGAAGLAPSSIRNTILPLRADDRSRGQPATVAPGSAKTVYASHVGSPVSRIAARASCVATARESPAITRS